jgi:hypothetical protein
MSADRWITDHQISTRYPLYTRANAGEVLPDPACPLGWTLVFSAINAGWRDSQINVGCCDADEVRADEVVGSFGGYLYINASLSRLFGVRGPNLTAEMIDLTYFGDHPDVPPYSPEGWHTSESNTARLGSWMERVLMEPLDELLADQAEANEIRLSRPDLRSLTDHELIERARSMQPIIRRLFETPSDGHCWRVDRARDPRSDRRSRRRPVAGAEPDHRHRRRRLSASEPGDVGALAARRGF